MALNRLVAKFWLDGGYDFDLVKACRLYPDHDWFTFDAGREQMTVCHVCGVSRCVAGVGIDNARCELWRHHEQPHRAGSATVEVGG